MDSGLRRREQQRLNWREKTLQSELDGAMKSLLETQQMLMHSEPLTSTQVRDYKDRAERLQKDIGRLQRQLEGIRQQRLF